MICSRTNQQKQNQKQQLKNKKSISYSNNEVNPPYALWLPDKSAIIQTALIICCCGVTIKKNQKVRHRLKQKIKTKQQSKSTDRYLLMSSLGSYLLPDTKHAQIRQTACPSIILRWKWRTEDWTIQRIAVSMFCPSKKYVQSDSVSR